MIDKPKSTPSRHNTFGISDSLLDAVKKVHGPITEMDKRPPGKLNKPLSGDSTGVKQHPATPSKRPVGGMGTVAIDIKNMDAAAFQKKYNKTKQAFKEENMAFKDSDYNYNRNSWIDSLKKVGKDGLQEEPINEMNITVEMNPGGTTYKVLSVSKDVGGRIKVGENLSDTHIDDLRDSDVSISYKGGKDGSGSKPKPGGDNAMLRINKGGKGIPQMKKAGVAKEEKDVMKHNCATHIESTEFGEGACITTQHADPDENGHVAWYDVMFEHGIERVMTEEVKVTKSESHMHSSKMKKKKAIMGSKMEEKDVMKHNCATHVKHEEFGEGNPIPGQHTLVEKEKKDCKSCKGTGKIDGEECDHCEGKGFHMEGFVTHYDVMFAEGIQKNIPVENLEILGESMHSHKMKKKKMIASKNKMEKMDPVGQGDADIDNDGDEDSSDKYLHKRRKAIKKAINKESFNENFTAPGKEQPKDAAQAYGLAEHYLQLANRDELFGRQDKKKVHEDFAKKFFDKYKEMVANGDESGEDTFKNEEITKKLESFSESENSQTNEALTKFSPSMDKKLADDEKATFKKQGTIKMRKSDGDGIHGTTVQADDKEKIAALKAKGYVRVSEEATPAQLETQRLAKIRDQKEKEKTKVMGKTHFQGVNDRKNAPKNEELKAVEYEGEIIYEGFDSSNLPEHAPEVVEHTPDNYSYNRNAWGNALAEVNRYKNKSGHRVTQPDKSGDEHIVMQLRKAVSVGANHSGVKFKDGATHKVSAKTAQKHLDHYSRLKPEDKIKWQNSAAHSSSGLSSASSEKKLGQPKPKASSSGRDEPTRRLINPMDRN
jgi:hypothetical protein